MGVGKPTIGYWEVYRWGFGKRQEGIGKKIRGGMLWWCLLLCIFSKAQAQPYVIGLGL